MNILSPTDMEFVMAAYDGEPDRRTGQEDRRDGQTTRNLGAATAGAAAGAVAGAANIGNMGLKGIFALVGNSTAMMIISVFVILQYYDSRKDNEKYFQMMMMFQKDQAKIQAETKASLDGLTREIQMDRHDSRIARDDLRSMVAEMKALTAEIKKDRKPVVKAMTPTTPHPSEESRIEIAPPPRRV